MKIISYTALSFFLLTGSCSKPKPVQLPPPPVTMTKPIICNTYLYNDYVGHLEANSSVEVRAQVAGTLTAKYFEEGQDVKEGDLLFTIDDRPYVAALAQAEAVLAQNLARLEYAEDTVTRYAKLAKQEYVSQLNYEEYLTNAKVDNALIKQNLAEIETAKVNLSYTRITAPFDCTTGILKIYPGNYVNAGGQDQIITLNQISPIQALFSIPEKDLQNIKSLQNTKGPLKTLVYLYDNQEHGYEGELAIINNQADLSTGSVLMKALLPNKNKELWPNQFVVVRVILGEKKNAMLLPYQAVQIGQTGPYVFVINQDETIELRQVTQGQRQGEYVIIEYGLHGNERVVLDGQLNLAPGMKVSIKNGQSSMGDQKQ